MRHEGEAAVQRRSGVRRADWGSARARPEIPAVAGDFLRAQRMIVIGAADASGRVWASALTGPAGFARPAGERTVVVGALPGRHDPLAALFRDGAGAGGGHEIGMLAIEPATRRRMRVNGRARRDGDRLTVRTDQVYANCPKYIQTREITGAAAGPPGEAGGASAAETLTPRQQAWIGRADTFFAATRVAGLGADVSHRGGGPGFVRVLGDRRLVWPEYAGNLMYMTLGNLELDERCGLLFLDWESGDALHLTGRARVEEDPGGVPGAERLVTFDVDEAVQVGGAVPFRWTFGEYSRHNPPVIPGTDG
ncbi:pyridoxamine 5'-phosphate oxidase family protein [Planomonospora parontospora]|uniref:pyridoxamine 5'-phosphate oxidase family protein n=1 Tax=Planomonospora parontospora TaxID=58119 RepID=UPI001671465A|nr:pyridoxamine 5'-phosphate oxidase family protein [Planomonospora parontospora]GGL05541.1 oxidoreductase [Planomonospora parontospora subsp. antibiotica]GII14307.1 oxidoreductase [Planomonospora parontospora subsp. antibiotica]